MGLDLGALLSGITQGMGSAQDFKLAEQMRAAADKQRADEKRQAFMQQAALSLAGSGGNAVGLTGDPQIDAILKRVTEMAGLEKEEARAKEGAGFRASAGTLLTRPSGAKALERVGGTAYDIDTPEELSALQAEIGRVGSEEKAQKEAVAREALLAKQEEQRRDDVYKLQQRGLQAGMPFDDLLATDTKGLLRPEDRASYEPFLAVQQRNAVREANLKNREPLVQIAENLAKNGNYTPEIAQALGLTGVEAAVIESNIPDNFIKPSDYAGAHKEAMQKSSTGAFTYLTEEDIDLPEPDKIRKEARFILKDRYPQQYKAMMSAGNLVLPDDDETERLIQSIMTTETIEPLLFAQSLFINDPAFAFDLGIDIERLRRAIEARIQDRPFPTETMPTLGLVAPRKFEGAL